MRILILNWRDLKHPRSGGSEVYAQNLARHWAAEGHEVVFFCSEVAGLRDTEVTDGYTIRRAGGRLGVYREAKAYYQRLPGGSFDVVLDVINTRPFLAPLWADSSRVVALIHQVAREVWKYEVPWPVSAMGRHYFEPRWLRVYQGIPVLTVSESSRASLLDYGLTEVSVVPEGVDPPLDRLLPAKAGTPTLLYVGRLSANKRPDHAIEAHSFVRRSIPDAELWVVGDGPMRPKLERMAGEGVTFFGRVDPPTKQDLMASAHALVATSVREGWGLIVSEAALLGTRSAGYDVPGLRDSIPAAGGLLTPPDPEGLAQSLISVLPRWMSEDRPGLAPAGVVEWKEVAKEVLTHLGV